MSTPFFDGGVGRRRSQEHGSREHGGTAAHRSASAVMLLVSLLVGTSLFAGCSTMDESYSGPDSELSHSVATRDGEALELGEEYSEYSKTRHGPSTVSGERTSALGAIVMYLPNRIVDFIDIFRVDVGVGPTSGGVIRLTRFAQAGVRVVAPFSARVGLFGGHELPFLLESSSEFGVSPAWVPSKDRKVGDWEFAFGLDFLLIGAHFGVELSEAVDFLLGIVGIDFKDDDL